MERRKFLIGAGSAAVGASALVGSGAFTSVSADRTVSVDVVGDKNAFLAFEKATNTDGSGNETVTENAEEYVNLSGSSKVSFDFTNANTGDNGDGNGVNKDATTIFDDLVDIVNQGTQAVEVGVESAPAGLGVYSEGADAASDDATQNDATAMNPPGSSHTEGQTIAPGERIQNVGIYVTDTSAKLSGTITFRAEAVNNND